ncbi:MAG: antibiotic biosynthesis monooxygenase family protein [Janthinobacterium lividum]
MHSGPAQWCADSTASGGAGTKEFCPPRPSRELTVIRSVLRLRAVPERADLVTRLYVDHAILERARAFGGCRDAQLLRGTGDDGATFLVMADWDTAEDYQRWVADPWRADVSRLLAELLDPGADEPTVGSVFELVPAGLP